MMAGKDGVYVPESIFNPILNTGHKPLDETGLHRLQHFADWAFSRPEHTIIIGGHSLWFRTFFKVFLSASDPHIAKTNKMANGGVVSLRLNKGIAKTGRLFNVYPLS